MVNQVGEGWNRSKSLGGVKVNCNSGHVKEGRGGGEVGCEVDDTYMYTMYMYTMYMYMYVPYPNVTSTPPLFHPPYPNLGWKGRR